jgi:hypothetical protein
MSLRVLMSIGAVVAGISAPVAAQVPSTPAKALSTAKVSGAPARTPDGQPNLQGVWSFAILTPLERPDDLAGKATLTDQEAAAYAKRKRERENKDSRDGSGTDADVGKAYNDAWWDFGTRASNQTSLIIDPPNGKLPALTAEGQKRKMAWTASFLTGVPTGPEDRTLAERCILGFNSGPPMLPSAYNNNVRIVQTKDQVAILNEMVHDTRIVPLDGRPHGTIRQWTGDSRGHWEGDTLVIDTINFTSAGTGVYAIALTTDENLHLVERFTRRDAHTLIYEITVSDPTIWTKPWTASVPMTLSDQPIFEYACHEGNRGMVGMLAGARADEAAAKNKSK